MSSHPRPRRHRSRSALAALVCVAGLTLAACGSDDSSDASEDVGTDATVVTSPDDDLVLPPSTGDTGGDTGDAPIGGALAACDLVEVGMVNSLLGTTGVTASPDTSLGLADGCRFASARTDVPALIVGYGSTLPYEDALRLACEDVTPVPVPTAAEGMVECYGAIIAPAGEGTLLMSIEDPTDQYDDATELSLAAAAATSALLFIQVA